LPSIFHTTSSDRIEKGDLFCFISIINSCIIGSFKYSKAVQVLLETEKPYLEQTRPVGLEEKIAVFERAYNAAVADGYKAEQISLLNTITACRHALSIRFLQLLYHILFSLFFSMAKWVKIK
jgi:hypothetical protein